MSEQRAGPGVRRRWDPLRRWPSLSLEVQEPPAIPVDLLSQGICIHAAHSRNESIRIICNRTGIHLGGPNAHQQDPAVLAEQLSATQCAAESEPENQAGPYLASQNLFSLHLAVPVNQPA